MHVSKKQYKLYRKWHKRLWNWLSKHSDKHKQDFFIKYPLLYVKNLDNYAYCYACMCAHNGCDKCPLEKKCMQYYQEYYTGCIIQDFSMKRYCAQKIADISWQPYKEWQKQVEEYEYAH